MLELQRYMEINKLVGMITSAVEENDDENYDILDELRNFLSNSRISEVGFTEKHRMYFDMYNGYVGKVNAKTLKCSANYEPVPVRDLEVVAELLTIAKCNLTGLLNAKYEVYTGLENLKKGMKARDVIHKNLLAEAATLNLSADAFVEMFMGMLQEARKTLTSELELTEEQDSELAARADDASLALLVRYANFLTSEAIDELLTYNTIDALATVEVLTKAGAFEN